LWVELSRTFEEARYLLERLLFLFF
jgi:hypothetical protein